MTAYSAVKNIITCSAAAVLAGFIPLSVFAVSHSGFDCADIQLTGGFEPEIFDRWLMKVSFDKDNVPTYAFFTPSGGGWQEAEPAGYGYAADVTGENNTTCTGIPYPEKVVIKNMTMYSYRGRNPLLSEAEHRRHYPAGMIDRFRFYRFTGDAKVAGLGVSLDSYLIAVDTYSKFVFAYGEVVQTQKQFGRQVPVRFAAVENSARPEGGRPFYEYDPIGYVNAQGEVFLYDEYCRQIAADGAERFFPSIKDDVCAVARFFQNRQGRSPYFLHLASR